MREQHDERANLLKSMIETEKDFTTEFGQGEFKKLLDIFPDYFTPTLKAAVGRMNKYSVYDPKELWKPFQERQKVKKKVQPVKETTKSDKQTVPRKIRKKANSSAGESSSFDPQIFKIEAQDFGCVIPTTLSQIGNLAEVVAIKTEVQLDEYEIATSSLKVEKSPAIIIQKITEDEKMQPTLNSNLVIKTEIDESEYVLGT